eukprot:CAMPEP_0171967608 /NCGR_PEP_ID=MMETSP0993-20121228/198738_1 /TAXON_ID=483369 /ORGANISM="non described non described, Strain CCMP2098" /LENGTH=76 /DNA_ID=CAMNT_0012617149 /DNA_START=166 /DNA_END=392 /DNA_ORIENTATION=+
MSASLIGAAGAPPLACGLVAKDVMPPRLFGKVCLRTSMESWYLSMSPTKLHRFKWPIASSSIFSPATATAAAAAAA